MAIIKLTLIREVVDTETDEVLSVINAPIWINTKYISAFLKGEKGTILENPHRVGCMVKETPEEILALIKEAENAAR